MGKEAMRDLARTGEIIALPRVPGGDWRFTRRALDLYLEQQEQITLAERGAAPDRSTTSTGAPAPTARKGAGGTREVGADH